jgi:glycosyltransferase involved in cell wall biosynthesis
LPGIGRLDGDRLACSVVVPCFNYGHCLAEAVASVQAQTRPVHEVIVVDDGSTDATPQIAASLPAVRYVRQENAGVAAARNRGLDLVTGTHVVFLDADDILAPSFIEECANALAGSDAGYAYATAQRFGADDVTWEAQPFNLLALKRRNFIPVTALMDVAKLDDVRFDGASAIGAWHDWDLFVNLASRGVYGVPAPRAIFYYRKHVGRDSMLDRFDRDQLAEPRALRYIQRKHRSLFTLRDRASTEKRILRLRLHRDV